ncbi:MAG TPA: XdhC/CoxI family protein [Pyrinomonadaceae bacterium]|nr:XdhC/CoxI family protein [Pyrinomonadaceae bacterium]
MPSSDNSVPLDSIALKILRLHEAGATAVLITLIGGPAHVGRKLLVDASGTTIGGLGDAGLDEAVVSQSITFLNSRQDTHVFRLSEFAPNLTGLGEVQVLFERIQPQARLVICGAGHVGAALAHLACVLGYTTTLIDDRAEFVTRAQFPDLRISLVAADNWFDAVTAAIGNGHGVYVAVVTRGHSEDESCMLAIMNKEVDYVGLIGSKRRTKIVIERLRAAGANDDQLKLVHAPIGLDIGAVTPEEVALAIMAEIVAVQRGGEGGSLSANRRTT